MSGVQLSSHFSCASKEADLHNGGSGAGTKAPGHTQGNSPTTMCSFHRGF